MKNFLKVGNSMRKKEEEIGKKIVEIRKERGMTQRDLAARCGIAQSTVYRIEAGKFSPRLDLLENMANALGRTVDLV